MSGLNPKSFAGVLKIIVPPKLANRLDEEDVQDDLEGEHETIPSVQVEVGNIAHVDELLTTLNEVSRGVSERTHDEYQC